MFKTVVVTFGFHWGNVFKSPNFGQNRDFMGVLLGVTFVRFWGRIWHYLWLEMMVWSQIFKLFIGFYYFWCTSTLITWFTSEKS